MRSIFVCCALLGVMMSWQAASSQAAEPMLAHDVYFTLKHDTDEAKEKLVAGCKKYLSDHPGVVWFAAGILVEAHQRDVNDRGFDVALHMVFKDKASHDRYQQADRHHQFIEAFQESWKAVRVFDSYVNASARGGMDKKQEKDRPDEVKKPRLPDPAASFAGMIRGKVAAKFDSGEFALAVDEVTEVWRSSKAEDPNSMVGKTVLVAGRKEAGRQIARFVRVLEVGETITVDVAHRGKGEALTILELTEEQRERAK